MGQYIERLIRKATAIHERDGVVPLDLLVELDEAGIDISAFL